MKKNLLKLLKMASKGLLQGILIQCLLFTVLLADNATAQSEQLSKIYVQLSTRDLLIKDVLKEIESKTNFSFVYPQDILPANEMVSFESNGNISISEILNELSGQASLKFRRVNQTIYIAERSGEFGQKTLNLVQERTISGKIISATDNQGLPGVNVVEKGTTNGTVTDVDGEYTLTVTSNATIVFSSVGFVAEEITVGNQSVVNLTMYEDIHQLQELVVIGYGEMKKSDLTGAVSVIDGADISQRKTIQMSQALQGSMPGVMVTRTNNAPGSTAQIRIRGITTIGDSNPLIILDGVPVGNINDINPNDVESITVLKDAASASIYGSRAAAGVILVTTKRAETGTVSLNYNVDYGFEQPTELPDYADAKRYMQMVNEIGWNDVGNTDGNEYPVYARDVVDNYASLHASDPDIYPDTDWQDLILNHNAPRQSHSLSIAAGTDVVKTNVSLAYDHSEALYKGFTFNRITGRMNNDININKFLNASVDLYAKRSVRKQPVVNPLGRRNAAPVYAAEWADGRVAEGKQGDNIYGRMKYGGFNDNFSDQLGGRIALNFTPVKGFKLSGVVSPQLNNTKSKVFNKQIPFYNADDPSVLGGYLSGANTTSLSEGRYDSRQLTTQFFANYDKSLGLHNLNAMAGYESFNLYAESLTSSSDQYELSSFPYLDLGNDNFRYNGGNAYENAYRSYFGRIMYNYDNRYFFQANIRYDGSSRFHEDYRWGSFPSFSAGWVLSEEAFMQDLTALSFLKLRGSWGSLGNERIGNYPYQATIEFGSALFYQGYDIVAAQTAAQRQYAIRDISWEKTKSFDFGIDAGFFDDKLRFTGDYFIKTTEDMLLALEIPDFMGFGNPDQNTGRMETKGWEMELAWRDQAGELNYNISFNLSDFRSVMGDLGGTEFLGDQIKIKGSEFNEWYGYVYDGIFQTEDEIANAPKLVSSARPGEVKYKDISGPDGVPDGLISPEYDRVFLGGSLPRLLFGSNIQLNYKNFDFGMVLQGVGKQNARLEQSMVRPYRERWLNMPMIIDGEYWSVYNTDAQNRDAKYPRMTDKNAGNNYAMSGLWLFDGSYLRLKNITLGYTLPNLLISKIGMQNLRIYTNVSDILSLNRYPKGWDPESSVSGYPITTAFIFGASVKF